jgi:hypothetical protein
MNSAIAAGQTVRVNGRTLKVTKASPVGVDLAGPRGGRLCMVRNVHTGQWILLVGCGKRISPEAVGVDTFEILA